MKNFNKIILSVGSNVGDRQKNILNSLKELSRISQIKKVSSLYDSEAILFEAQENFFNLVVQIEYKKSPQDLLRDIKKIEKLIGRKETFRYGPRVIDVDIIFFNNTELQDKELIIPHYDWQNRRFVIEPLSELFDDFNLLDYKIKDQKLVKVGTINYK